MFKLVALSAALIATTAASHSSSSPPANSNSQAGSNGQTDDPNETICRNLPVSGSRVNRMRVCRTRAEWANSREVTREGRNRRGSDD